jgi:hypothetical protein
MEPLAVANRQKSKPSSAAERARLSALRLRLAKYMQLATIDNKNESVATQA